MFSFRPKTKYAEDLIDTNVSDDTDISYYSFCSGEEEGDEYDDDPYVEDTTEATELTACKKKAL